MEDLKQSLKVLRHFTLLNKLADEQLIVLTSRANFKEFRKGKVILELGSSDSFDYFLLAGEVRLIARDGRETRITAASDRARQALAHLRPRQFEVRAVTPCKLLVVDQPTLTKMLKEVPTDYTMDEVQTFDSEQSPAYSIIANFHQDLKAHRLKLPSLPDLAFKIRELSESTNAHVKDIAKAIMRDPPITAKLVHAANSPLYRGFNEIESCQDAVVRLGMDTTRQLITVFTMRELFKSNSEVLKRRMANLWEHSLEVGAIAFVLGRMTPGLSAERAMLAGILHDIGVVPIIHYAEDHPELEDDAILAELIPELREEIGSALLKNWDFPDVFIDVVRYAEEYGYDSGQDNATYADLIIIAQVHAFIGKKEGASLPPMDQIPAFDKLAMGELSPQRSLQVLQMSKEEIESLKQVFTATY